MARRGGGAVMRRVSLRNLAAHKVRLALTLISVMLGTAFVAGSFVFTDTLKGTFDRIFADTFNGVDVGVSPSSGRGAGVPTDLVPVLQHLPGVRAVQVSASGPVVLVDRDGKAVKGGGAPSIGAIWSPAGESLDKPPSFESGREPAAADEVVINAGAAKKAHLAPGSRTKVLAPAVGTLDVTISGVYHTDSETGGYVGVLFTRPEALRLFTDGSHVASVRIAGSGVDQKTLRDRVAAVLPAGLEAKTGDQLRADTKSDVATALSFVNYFLLAFGLVALVVGTFIIYNTFSMIVAQRVRELALLRAIGADRRQVRRSVLLEAGIIGLIGSGLGIAAGVGLAYALRAFLDVIGTGLPSGGLTLAPRTVIVGVAVGVIVTLLSANAPSRRAARTPPVAAMRAEFASTGTSLRRRTWIGAVLGALGGLVTVLGAVSSDAGSGASLIGLGLLGVGGAAMLLSPALSRIVIGGLGRIIGRPFGSVGRLARTNAVRNPRRTAATAFALTLGLLLVSGIAVIGASAKKSINAIVDNDVTADFVLTTQSELPVPLPAARAASAVPGIGSFVQLQALDTRIDGVDAQGTAVDGKLTDVNAIRTRSGTFDISGLQMAISQKTADAKKWTVGRQVTLSQPGGSSRTLTISGIYADTQLFASWIVSGDVYRALTPKDRWFDQVALVKAAPGADQTALRQGLERATDPFYIVDVQDKEQFKGQQASQINGLLGILYGLLGLAIVIAILGIINTLALSVVERRREIGMLRAVGAQRGQVRRTIYLESLLIAVFGALLGLALGLTFGALFTHALRNEGLGSLQIPWGQALVFLVLAAVVGVLAALWPAIRAARTRPLEAIAEP